MADAWHGKAPTHVLSDATIQAALARANSANSKTSSAPTLERRSTGSKKEKKEKHQNCDCMDCRDPAVRENAGTIRYDPKTGDMIQEMDDSQPSGLHCHVQPGLFDDDKPEPPRRTSTASSSKSSRKSQKSDPNIATRKDAAGNVIQEWDGAESPDVRPHYDWDAGTNKKY